MLRGVKNPLATLRKSRCSGGSISMMVFMAPKEPVSPRRSLSCWRFRMSGPRRLLKVSGLLEMSMMSACRVMAQKCSNSSSAQWWTGACSRSSVQTSWG